MPPITEGQVKRYWLIAALVASVVAGGAVWATNVERDVDALRRGQNTHDLVIQTQTEALNAIRLELVRIRTVLEKGEGR